MEDKIAYFELLKDLPGCPAGSSFTYLTDGFDETIACGPIKFPAYFAIEHPDWFRPVTIEQYKKAFRDNFFYYGMNELGKSRIECEAAFNRFLNE